MAFYCQQEAFELLESNLENLSNELNGLLLSNEIVCNGQGAAVEESTIRSYLRSNECASNIGLNPKMPCLGQNRRITKQMSVETCLGVQQSSTIQALQNVQPFYGREQPSYNQSLTSVQQTGFERSLHGFQKTFNSDYQQQTNYPYLSGQSNKFRPAIGTIDNATVRAPVCEFYYLRSQSSNYRQSSPMINNQVPLISSALAAEYTNSFNGNVGNGAIKKYNHLKYNRKSVNVPVDPINLDHVVVNMKELGLSNEIVENNGVIRLMNLFYLLNYYLHDVIPFGRPMGDETIDPKSIPHTMNLQKQLKNAIRNCTIFIGAKERILNYHKLSDPVLYAECERSLNIMRKLCLQLEMYKRVNLEHKRYQFITEIGKEKAQRLELLLEQLNSQVREINIFVHVFDWAVKTGYAYIEYQDCLASDKVTNRNVDGDANKNDNQCMTSEGKEPLQGNITQTINRYIG